MTDFTKDAQHVYRATVEYQPDVTEDYDGEHDRGIFSSLTRAKAYCESTVGGSVRWTTEDERTTGVADGPEFFTVVRECVDEDYLREVAHEGVRHVRINDRVMRDAERVVTDDIPVAFIAVTKAADGTPYAVALDPRRVSMQRADGTMTEGAALIAEASDIWAESGPW